MIGLENAPADTANSSAMVSHALDRGTDPTQVLRDLEKLLNQRTAS